MDKIDLSTTKFPLFWVNSTHVPLLIEALRRVMEGEAEFLCHALAYGQNDLKRAASASALIIDITTGLGGSGTLEGYLLSHGSADFEFPDDHVGIRVEWVKQLLHYNWCGHMIPEDLLWE